MNKITVYVFHFCSRTA